MPQRIYTDPSGVRWVVWDVYPQDHELASLRERRLTDDRRMDHPRRPVLERRDATERRVRPDGIGRAFAPGYEGGWLVFRDAARHVVRRLAPAPLDWETCDEATLDAYRRQATPSREMLDRTGVPLEDRARRGRRPSGDGAET